MTASLAPKPMEPRKEVRLDDPFESNFGRPGLGEPRLEPDAPSLDGNAVVPDSVQQFMATSGRPVPALWATDPSKIGPAVAADGTRLAATFTSTLVEAASRFTGATTEGNGTTPLLAGAALTVGGKPPFTVSATPDLELSLHLRTARDLKLGTQAYIHRETPDLNLLQPVVNDDWQAPESYPQINKPKSGGLWTSTYSPESGSEWVDFMNSDLGKDSRYWNFQAWLLPPKPESRLYVVNSYADVDFLYDRYGIEAKEGGGTVLDFERMSHDFDGIHATFKGTRCLDGWDIESTLWFHWNFENVEDGGPVRQWYRDFDLVLAQYEN